MHLDENIALKNFAVDDAALAVFNVDLLFLRDEGLENLALHFCAADTLINAVCDFVFIAGVSTNCVPR